MLQCTSVPVSLPFTAIQFSASIFLSSLLASVFARTRLSTATWLFVARQNLWYLSMPLVFLSLHVACPFIQCTASLGKRKNVHCPKFDSCSELHKRLMHTHTHTFWPQIKRITSANAARHMCTTEKRQNSSVTDEIAIVSVARANKVAKQTATHTHTHTVYTKAHKLNVLFCVISHDKQRASNDLPS